MPNDEGRPFQSELALQAIAAFCLKKAAEIEKELHHDVKRLAEDAIYQKYLSIARKAQVNRMDMEFQERRAKGGKPIEPGAEGETL